MKIETHTWKKMIEITEANLKVKAAYFEEDLKDLKTQLGSQKSLFEQMIKSLESQS